MDISAASVLMILALVYFVASGWANAQAPGRRLVTCPVDGRFATVELERTGLPRGRSVTSCSLWPRAGCQQACAARPRTA